jgi:hypothetical protein
LSRLLRYPFNNGRDAILLIFIPFLKKEIYEAILDGKGKRVRHRRTFLDNFELVLEKGQVKRTRNRRACMRNLMKVEKVKGVCVRIVASGKKRSLPTRI